ncbi:aspartate aminotransferase family protein [Aerosakkonema funiforme]|uniref:aspartate aminotransferase family protein n=1 Tax=Aerosakkonema funiforme TaxID=1246630 RepID=UPI0035B719E8
MIQEAVNLQQSYLSKFIDRYNKRTQTSKQFTQKYRPILADPRVSDGFNFFVKEMLYPIVAKQSLGSKIWDIDGNEYIDLIMGFGINLFGHNPPFIKEALQEQLELGIQIGPQIELVGEVAELICQLTQMERVTFSNTGTEAVMTAVRIARAVTGRHKIVLFSGSYHGHFDGTLAKAQATPIAPGVLPNFVADILVLDYGNPQSLEIIESHKNELAAVLVEPVQTRRPNFQPKEFLLQLRQLTKESDIPLIFDEMVTGFRIHPGGAQAYFGIQADIATYGKIVGGGMPIGIIAGKAAYMDAIDGGMWNYGDNSSPQTKKTFFAGTHCKHPLSIAAARAVLKHLKMQGSALQENLNQRTSQFVITLNNYFEQEGLPIRLANFGSLFGPAVSGNDDSDNSTFSAIMDLLFYHLIDKGILLRGVGNFLSTSHTDEDCDRIIQAVKDSVAELQDGGFLPKVSLQASYI